MKRFRRRIIPYQQGQYFEVKIEYVELSPEEFNQRMAAYSSRLAKYFAEGKRLGRRN